MKTLKYLSILLISLVLFASCNNQEKGKYLPNVTGKPGEVLLVIEKGHWEGEIGSLLKDILASDYPFLPQREPIFTLYNATHSSFQDYGPYSAHRNIIIFYIGSNHTTPKVTIQEDLWAAPQVVISLFAPDQKSALGILSEKKELVINALEQAERDRIIRNAKKYQEISIRKQVLERYGGSPYFPQGYGLKKITDDFMWISYETTYLTQGIFIYSYPYNGETLTKESVIEKRNEVMKANVPGMRDNSYMITGSFFHPSFNWMKYKNRTFAETRGLWEVENDYMGGPFVCHSFWDKENKRIIVLEGFVYAPKFDKRNYLRQVESILYSFEWENE